MDSSNFPFAVHSRWMIYIMLYLKINGFCILGRLYRFTYQPHACTCQAHVPHNSSLSTSVIFTESNGGSRYLIGFKGLGPRLVAHEFSCNFFLNYPCAQLAYSLIFHTPCYSPPSRSSARLSWSERNFILFRYPCQSRSHSDDLAIFHLIPGAVLQV